MKFKGTSIITVIFLSFFALFVFLSFKTMFSVSFYDFDEAHRAENAKRMKEYGSFFVPLTGSPQDRVEHLKVPLRENPDLHLYYHLERPPLVYDLMILSTSLFGSYEWAYRLPSFLLGIATVAVFLFFARKEEGKNVFAIATGLLVLFTSFDLWLSSEYAQMDTGITLFLFLSLLTLITFCSTGKTFLIFLSGIFFGLGLLSKLQPTVIFIFPLIFLLLTKKLKLFDLMKFSGGFLLVFLPWVIYLALRFGIKDVVNIMPGFAITSASIINIHQQAPIFWYLRWLLTSLRPGWILFLTLFAYEIISGSLDWKKKALLIYIFGGLLAFSLPDNKIWWYILPLIPAVAYFVYLSLNDYLKEKPHRLINLSFAIIVASLPIFLRSSNKLTIFSGILISAVVFFILIDKLAIKLNFKLSKKNIFNVAIILCLLLFLQRFPEIIPYHRNTKGVAEYYKNLPGSKCLWLGDMPGEAVLFYSNAGEVPILDKTSQIYSSCKNNYLITPEKHKDDGELILRQGNIRLYKL